MVRVAGQLGRSEWWVHKWLRRYEAEGERGLVDRSRAPRRRPSATPGGVVGKILEVRCRLDRSEFGGISAESILYEMEAEGFQPRPSRATVERVLQRAGVTRKGRRRDRGSGQHRPHPAEVAVPGVWQQMDWVGPRYLARQVRFSSLHLVDVGGGGAAAAQYPNEQLANAVAFLCERAWPRLGIPLSVQVDGAFCLALPTRSLNPWNAFVRACIFFGVEVVICPPNELGWQNHVESFNALWQARTIRRHRSRRNTLPVPLSPSSASLPPCSPPAAASSPVSTVNHRHPPLPHPREHGAPTTPSPVTASTTTPKA